MKKANLKKQHCKIAICMTIPEKEKIKLGTVEHTYNLNYLGG